jgi:hypothetical protein
MLASRVVAEGAGWKLQNRLNLKIVFRQLSVSAVSIRRWFSLAKLRRECEVDPISAISEIFHCDSSQLR